MSHFQRPSLVLGHLPTASRARRSMASSDSVPKRLPRNDLVPMPRHCAEPACSNAYSRPSTQFLHRRARNLRRHCLLVRGGQCLDGEAAVRHAGAPLHAAVVLNVRIQQAR
jgi:hypothetical protein